MLLFGNHQNVALLMNDPCHPMGAGASMSPGSQILALTATSANANSTTISAGKRVVRKKDNGVRRCERHSAGEGGATAAMSPQEPPVRPNR